MTWAVHRGRSGAGESIVGRGLSVPTGQRVHILHHVEAHSQRGDDQGAAGPQRARLQLGESPVIHHGQRLPVELDRPVGPGEGQRSGTEDGTVVAVPATSIKLTWSGARPCRRAAASTGGQFYPAASLPA